MINKIYETHLFVEDLERAIAFYRDVLSLELAYQEKERKAAFFWVGPNKASMLGLWTKPAAEIAIRHFAFEVSVNNLFEKAIPLLERKAIPMHNFIDGDSNEPFVFAWMPALSIYFQDPDGHSLEFIAPLEGKSHPEWGVIAYDDWKRRMNLV